MLAVFASRSFLSYFPAARSLLPVTVQALSKKPALISGGLRIVLTAALQVIIGLLHGGRPDFMVGLCVDTRRVFSAVQCLV